LLHADNFKVANSCNILKNKKKKKKELTFPIFYVELKKIFDLLKRIKKIFLCSVTSFWNKKVINSDAEIYY